MARPRSREALKEYCLRRLGHPVTQINVAPEQIEDRIDDAIQFFAEYHFEGVEKVHLKYTATQDDITFSATTGYMEFDIPTNVVSVTQVYSISDDFTENFFDVKYQTVLNDLTNWGYLDLSGYSQTRDYYALLDFMLDPAPRFEHQRVKDKLKVFLQGDDGIRAGGTILFEAYVILDPEVYTKIYDEILMKRYCTALIKKQWGSNLSKFENVTMPGGIVFNGQQIYQDANEEVQKIEEEIFNTHNYPPGGFLA